MKMFLVIFLISCTRDFSEISIDNGEKIIKTKAEIADDDEERARGLMYKENLNENEGMFFVFNNEDYQTFWMKNMVIPLDIIFIDKYFKIVDLMTILQ